MGFNYSQTTNHLATFYIWKVLSKDSSSISVLKQTKKASPSSSSCQGSINFAAMEYDLVRSKKSMKRVESTKSHPYWWDSHIGPKNTKWLENNLDEMDRSVKRMVKLIEEDAADSFAKKAEMYFQKRPELIALVDEFHRMYRSLAERYENITGELRKGSSVELQSQGSGFSDVSSTELNTELSRLGRAPSRRAPGFDYFLGYGGHPSDLYQINGDDSASIDSEMESDDSSVTNHPGYVSIGSDFQSLSKRIADLESELREAKERQRMQLEGNTESLMTRVKSENKFVDFPSKLAACEQELRDANEKIQNSDDQIHMLKIQLARYLPSELDDENGSEEEAASTEDLDIQALSEELRITTLRLREAEKENGVMRKQVEKSKSAEANLKSLQHQLESAQKESTAWKNKSSADRREVVKLLDRVSMMKSSLAGRDHEIRDLKTAVSDAEEKIFPEKAQVKAEISKLLEEKTHRDDQFKELEANVRYLEDEIRRVTNEKLEEEERLKGEIEALIVEKAEEERRIEKLSKRVSELESEISQLVDEMKAKDGRTTEMEKEVEKQRRELEEVAEEKREVIRQLCFSLDYSKDECKRLRSAFSGHRPKSPASVLAS